MNVVEVLTTIRSSRFDLPLTYDAGDLSLQIGDVVCVPLGPRTVPGFVISAM
ncbi:MAG: primosomal protein N' family DNA-binding protein, partial [Vulcanimicrobiaceae bacterium]